MSTRNIRIFGDPVLRKVSKPVKDMNYRNEKLVSDMLETMYEAGGVGLAAPQVGILKRIVVIDVEDGHGAYIMVNPEIVEIAGEQTGDEGCLSCPGKHAEVTRPNYVRMKAFDIHMEPYELEATELLARAICHEVDHLDGILYEDRAKGPLRDNSEYDDEE